MIIILNNLQIIIITNIIYFTDMFTLSIPIFFEKYWFRSSNIANKMVYYSI